MTMLVYALESSRPATPQAAGLVTGDRAFCVDTMNVFHAIDAMTWMAKWGAAAQDFNYNSLTNKPTLGTAAATATTDYATAAQGTKADTAVQPTRTVAGHALSADIVVSKGDVGLGSADNTSDAGKPVSMAQQTALDLKAAKASNLSDLANAATARTNLGLGAMATFAPAVSACPATTGTMTVTMGEGGRTITPTGACTFNASGGVIGQRCTFLITTSGTTSFTLTWGTNVRKTGTLATGTASARFFAVTFFCIDGTIWEEIGRTAAQT